MPETGVCDELRDLIDQQAAGRRIISVRLRVGARHAVVNEAFDQAFALIADGTAAQGAVLDLVVTPATVSCHSCGGKGDAVDRRAVCPWCGAVDVDITGGDDLALESLQFGLAADDGAT
jgi:hydrogenase nickel incorporation protein HypA/HybF